MVVVVERGGLRGVSAPSLTTLDQSKKLCWFFFCLFLKQLIKAYTVIFSMQSYKILHFCFLLGYGGYLQVFVCIIQ